MCIKNVLLAATLIRPSLCFLQPHKLTHQRIPQWTPSHPFRLRAAFTTTTPTSTATVGPRIAINEKYPNLTQIHTNPDIFIIKHFLDETSCQDLINQALAKNDMTQSPVAYAGWTSDFADLADLAVKGPVSWLAILRAWIQIKDDPLASQLDLVVKMVQNFGLLLVVALIGIAGYTKFRTDGLQQLRTSTSTTLNKLSDGSGARTFVSNTAALLRDEKQTAGSSEQEVACKFEAPTVIRYEAGQVLAPHYDANRSAATEDANRGGQTLATLLVYLNNVDKGGLTRFGKLHATQAASSEETKLTVQPKMGDALLFFPADAQGVFDERTEHEGCPAVDEKWIARIWRHVDRVPPPFGLEEEELAKL